MKYPILAIDYGLKHIGLAMSDYKGIVSTPLDVLHITKNRDIDTLIVEIGIVIEENKIESLLVGVPQEFTKAQSINTKRINTFIKKLLKHIDLPYQTYDESFSTVNAQNMLLSTGKSTKSTKKRIDSVAAAIFLQEFLNLN